MSESRKLPDALWADPDCGACLGETESDGDSFACDRCGLIFDEYLTASFIDEEAEACAKPCANEWHGDSKVRPGWVHDCGTCLLPEGHVSSCYTACVVRRAGDSQ